MPLMIPTRRVRLVENYYFDTLPLPLAAAADDAVVSEEGSS